MLARFLPAFIILLTGSACATNPVSDGAKLGQDEVVEVMVLGTYHFANPGADAFNIEVDNVLTDKRQNEIKAVTLALAEWEPTKILVEFVSTEPDLSLPSFEDFDPAMLETNPNEVFQIGYRLAHHLQHETVFGFDEQPSEGEPNYFPLGSVLNYAETHTGQDIIDGIISYQQDQTKLGGDYQRSHTIAESLMYENDPERSFENHQKLYYGVLEIGDGEVQPGAELNAYWYMRNAKMFAKADLIAEPGDRVLILVGAGHQYWLSHFVDVLPDYVEVDSRPYLERAQEYSVYE